ncbi:MAG: carboxypeptidase regulatory-like domain-containing protein [Sphingomonas sp.]|uniref:TonB-dependent receptor n=1 Tax=Sphingomonas sp. TaxID=28214 RepID=UPI001AFF1C13|nr:TonB-dependent receptor [Sphingomonas sp.]MBO9621637.1 carboxypeptidase regulatory-like domain-containing protein [Sphingomonas sp.]
MTNQSLRGGLVRQSIFCACSILALAVPFAHARAAATQGQSQPTDGKGELTGRVIDPATGSYLRNADVRIETAGGQVFTATTGDDGVFSLNGLPAGPAKVTIRFIGHLPQTQDVTIAPGGTVRVDFELLQTGRDGEAASADEIVVSGEREGQANSIMAQRREMQIADVISTEAYGDIAGGNPAEMIKFMPGVDVDGTNGSSIYASLRGLPGEFTRTQLNGMDVISANANSPTGYANSAAAARVFSYEAIGISAIDSIVLYKTVGADQNADAPAGIVDLRTKHAYNRKKPVFTVSLSAFTSDDMLDKYPHTGPKSDGWGSKRFLPNGSLFFADSFLGNRLGVMFSLGFADQYLGYQQNTMSRSYAPTAKSPSPLAFTAYETAASPRETTRRTGSLQLDFKANDHLSFGFLSILYRGDVYQNTTGDVTYTTGARNGVIGDPLSNFTTLSGAKMTVSGGGQYKVNNGNILAPSFEWRSGNFRLDGSFAYSDSHSYYDTLHREQVGTAPTLTLSGTPQFNLFKNSAGLMGTDWTVIQTAGPDWSNPANYTMSAAQIRTSGGQDAFIYEKSGQMNAYYDTHLGDMPLSFKAGFKISDTNYRFGDDTNLSRIYNYSGPMTNAEFIQHFVNPYKRTVFDQAGSYHYSLSGSNYIPTFDTHALYLDFVNNPGNWTKAVPTAANYAAAAYNNSTKFEENIKAAYGMVTAEVAPRMKLRAGLRAEWADNTSFGYTQMPAADLATHVDPGTGKACAVDKGGIATTIPCVDIQYGTNGIQRTTGSYFKLFPSASLKWTVGQSNDIDIGYSNTILRPGLNATAGNASYDPLGGELGTGLITIPNPGLTPATSDNFSARYSRYFKSVGLFNIGVYYNRISGLAVAQSNLTAEEAGSAAAQALVQLGIDDPTGILFTTYKQVSLVTIKGVEASFQHSFSWLPAPFDGLSVRGAFMHNEPNTHGDDPLLRLGNNIGSAAITYEKGPVRFYVNLLWNDDKLRSTTPSWFQARTDLSMNLRVKLTRQLEMFATMANVLNKPYNVVVPGSLAPAVADQPVIPNHTAIENWFGRSGTIGFRARL